MIHLDRSNGNYADLAIIPLGTSVNGYLVVKVGQRIDAKHVTDITEFPDLPALPLSAAKNKLQELAAEQSSPAPEQQEQQAYKYRVGAKVRFADSGVDPLRVLKRTMRDELPEYTVQSKSLNIFPVREWEIEPYRK